VSLADTLRLALNNLRQAKLRTGLTSLGVAIGIAALIGMVSLGVGLQDQLLGRFMASGVFDAITVTGGSNNLPAFLGGTGGRRGGRAGGRGGGSAPNATAPARPEPPVLDEAALATLAALPNVKQVVPAIRVPLLLKMGDFQEGGTAVGIPLSARDEGAFRTMTAGAFFANETDDACLLSLDVAKRIAPDDPASLVGQTLMLSYTAKPDGAGAPAPPPTPAMPMPMLPGIGAVLQMQRVDRPYRIAGIVEREPGPNVGSFGFASVMIPLPKAIEIDGHVVRSAQQLLADASGPATRTYASVTVKVTRAQHTQDVEEQIKKLGYTAFSLNDALQGAKRAFIVIDILLSLIGSIALAVSSLGIVNTMVMSILERTREIGVMKAIGASDGAIRRIFLVEASAIGLIGGVAGIVLGWVVARVVNYGANIYIVREGGEAGSLFSFPLWLVGGALVFSWLISLIAGSYPARRAARLNPIQALRHD
jgi:putative ABC transport system permease protein